ncbi:MAG: response regulator [Actinobacteria bacterium]|nr:response regulator [Actinomycetota bacterium]
MGEKILIVDDDATMANLLSTVLEFEGFHPLKALSGDEAVRMVKEENPDLVLLDIMMPGMDGFEVLARLRKDPRTEKMPVIMLTARTDDRDMFEGWRRGADEYVTKPFDPHRLVVVIREVLARSYEERLEERARHVEYLLDLLSKIDGEKAGT